MTQELVKRNLERDMMKEVAAQIIGACVHRRQVALVCEGVAATSVRPDVSRQIDVAIRVQFNQARRIGGCLDA